MTICENGSDIARSKDSGYDNASFEKNYPQFRSGNLSDENESKNLSHDYYYVVNNIPKITYAQGDSSVDATIINHDERGISISNSPYHSKFDNSARRRSSRTLHSVNSEVPKKD